MATISPESATFDDDLRLLASTLPEGARSASAPHRFTVKYTLMGTGLLDLQDVLAARVASVGADGVSCLGNTVSVHGVERGREDEVLYEVRAGIEKVNCSRTAAREALQQREAAGEAPVARTAGGG